jgi:ribosomal protein S12 methylthiotransferase accessory factor
VASGLRVASPAATLARLEPQISPLTGVVKWLTEVIGDPDGLLHGYSAGHSLSLGPDTLRWLRRSLNAHARGKGATDQEARVSALGEAIERYCGVFHEDVTCRRATYAELGGQAIHPHRCLNFSARQYERREALNAGGADGYLHMVPRPFPEDLELDWVALWSLIDEEVRYLPAALCYYAHRDVERHLYCAGDSSGCAAGTVLEEAVLHAFLELVERDAVAMWWYNQVVRPAVDLDSCGDPYLARVRDRHARDGRELCALDLTSDLGLPVIAAVSRRLDGPAEELLFGFGAHLDPAAALRHAVNEVNQFLPSVARHGPDGRTHYAWHDEAAIRFWRDETLASQPQLGPDRAVRPRRLGELPCVAVTDLYDGLRACLEIVRRKGLDLLVLDQSRADVDLAVARVVVPGMRHFWRRLGPGRLYDVPVQLGWLDTPKAEDELNRVSIFF